MGKAARRKERTSASRNDRRSNRNGVENVYDIRRGNNSELQEFGTPTAKTLTAKNSEQKSYINTIKNTTVTVGIGDPGTGKTFIPSVLAAQELCDPRSDIEHIILVRPNEPLGKSLGMLPGTLAEKLEPWLEPIADGVKWAIGDYAYKGLVEREKIKFLAIEHARGRTFNNSYVIVDEAQNVTREAMICLLTRIGQNCKLIICGDIAQKDIKSDSGLGMLIDLSNKYENVPFTLVELVENVRSGESKAFHALFKQEGLV